MRIPVALMFALGMPFFCYAEVPVDCKHLDAAASETGVQIPGHASGRQVTGKGRLQFHSAPNLRCKMPGVFILANETVHAYVEYQDFTSVLYLNPRTGKEALGWVESSRLRPNGEGIAPAQRAE